jgi:hypothetical protein
MHQKTLAALALIAGLAATARAQDVGTSLPDEIELQDLSGTQAHGFDQFYGRAVLIEFFAYW